MADEISGTLRRALDAHEDGNTQYPLEEPDYARQMMLARRTDALVGIAARAADDADDADAQVTPGDLKAWIAANGPIPDGACVAALHSGWAARVDSDAYRGFDGEKQHYPGFHVEAAQMLIEETGARSIGVDTLSLDHGPSADVATHYAWLPTGRCGIENLANPDRVPAAGATVVVGAPKHRGGTGGPARILALV